MAIFNSYVQLPEGTPTGVVGTLHLHEAMVLFFLLLA
jgi:hypothetical protein